MPGYLAEYRLRVRTKADNADLLSVSSVRGDTAPYLIEPPSGDGASFDPLTGESMAASYSGLIADAPTTGTSRLVTSQLEDVNQRLQLGYLKAYWERRQDGGAWSVLVGGYLTLFRLVSGIGWEFNVQDASRLQGGIELFNAGASTTIATALANWPNRGCLFGGPVMGTFMSLEDFGGWQMKVHVIDWGLPAASGGHGAYWLEPVWVYGPSNDPSRAWKHTAKLDDEYVEGINGVAGELTNGIISARVDSGPFTTIGDTYAMGVEFPGLVVLVDGTAFRPSRQFNHDPTILGKMGWKYPGVIVWNDGQTALTNGQLVRVRCLTMLPSDACPIYEDRHPVDHLTNGWTLAGLGYDSAATTSLKQTLGTGLRHSIRITGAKQLGQYLSGAAYKPFGIAVRHNASGQLVPFSTNLFANIPPTKTITDAMIASGHPRTPFELDVGQGLQRITFRQKVQTLRANAPDGVVESDMEITLLNGDASALPSGTLEIEALGMIRSDPTSTDPVGPDWLQGRALQLFDRFGRGMQTGEFTLVRGDGTTDADTLNLGDEVLASPKELPNHNKRLGDDPTVSARAMQAVQITEGQATRTVRLADSGPNAQPLSTKPTHTIAATADSPRTVAQITITNAAALNGLSYAVQIQIAATTGAAPSTTDYVDAHALPAGSVPATAVRLPAVAAGRTLYVRARSWKTGSRPSDWTTPVSVALSSVNNPSALAAASVTGDGSQEDITWTPGASTSDFETDVYVRANGAAFSTAIRQGVLMPGSNAFRLQNLTPSTAYTASVQHRDPRTGDKSNAVDVNFTAGASTLTLSAPVNPRGFTGPPRIFTFGDGPQPSRDGRYGIAVQAVEFPGFIEVQEAVETSVGSGTYGSFAVVSPRMPSVSGDWTAWMGFAPNDRLRRQLKAQHVRDGCTASAFTSVVTVTPWVSLPLLPYRQDSPGSLVLETNGSDVIINLAGPDTCNSWRYAVSTSAMPADSSVDAGTVDANRVTRITKSTVTPNLGDRYYVKARAYTGANGDGNGGPYITSEVERQNKSQTKKMRFPVTSFVPNFSGIASWNIDSAGYLRPGAADGTTRSFYGFVVLPDGVTIELLRLRGYKTNNGGGTNDLVDLFLFKMQDAAFSQIARCTLTATGAWTSVTDSTVSQLIDNSGTDKYLLEIDLMAHSGGVNTDARFGWAEIEYTVPDLGVSV